MILSLRELVELCRAEAISCKLSHTEASAWRSYCREYSKMFHTPYHLVLDMEPEFVVLAVCEDNLDDINVEENLENLMNRIYTIEDPSYEASQEQELQDWIKDAENEEKDRVSEGRPVHSKKKKTVPKKPVEEKKEARKEGYLDLSYLEKQDNESED